MADPSHFSPFQLKFLTGENPNLSLDAEFLRKHKKVVFKSDETDKVWEVKLDGGKLAGGWEEFVAVHKCRDGDVLVFKHEGNENFLVSVSPGDTHHPSPSYVDTVDSYTDDDDDDDADSYTDDDGEDEDDIGNKNEKHEATSSSDQPCIITKRVTRYSLQKDRTDLPLAFKNVVSEYTKPREIDLVNTHGRRWTLSLGLNRSSGIFYMHHGWRNFCYANKKRVGDSCEFELENIGERPKLSLCSHDSNNASDEEDEEGCPEADAEQESMCNEISKRKEKKKMTTHSPFLTLEYTPSRSMYGQLAIPSAFARENGITKRGETILMDKDGRKWSSKLGASGDGRNRLFYLRRGWREMCKANGVKVNDSFVLELVWQDANPLFKFVSKIENKGKEIQRTHKKRGCERGLGETSKQTNTRSRKLLRRQPKSCSISDQVSNVRQGILDTLKTVRKFRVELETREENLEASLLEIDVLGESILGISKLFNNTVA